MAETVESDDRRSRAHEALHDALAELAGDTSGRVMMDDITALAAAVTDTATPDLTGDVQARLILGWWRWARFQAAAAPDDQAELEGALEFWEPVASVSPGKLPPQVLPVIEARTVERLSDLALERVFTYEQTGETAVLEEAVEMFREVVRVTSVDHLDRGRYLSNLGVALHSRFESTGDLAALDEVVSFLREASDVLPDDDPLLGSFLANVGSALLDRFGRTGDVASLEEAIAKYDRATATMPDDHPDFAACLSSLCDALRLSFEHTGDAAALDRAIEVGRRAVRHADDADDADVGGYLSNLGSALKVKFSVTGNEKLLDEAIACLRQAVASTPNEDPGLAAGLSNLGAAMHGRFQRTGDIDALDEASRTLHRAIAVAGDGNWHLGAYLSNLGGVLLDTFQKTGNSTVLDEAVGVLRRAAAATSDRDPNLGQRLSNLGSALQISFEYDGDTAALDEAVDVGRRAASVTPAGDHNLGMHLSNLGNALRNRFLRTEDPAALDEAVETYRRAVEVTASDHADLAMYLTNLGVALRYVFERSGDTRVLDQAEDVLRQAVKATRDEHPYAGMYLANLANALHTRFESTKDLTGLREAIGLHREAVRVTPTGDADLSGHLFNLGCALQTRFEHTGDRADLDPARKALADAWFVESAPLDVRISSADRAADVDLAAGDPEHALLMAERAVGSLGVLAPRRLRRSDRGHRITSMAGIAATAATAAIVAGEQERAVELLEQSRGLLLAETLGTRGDLTALRHRAPDLAAEFGTLREEFDRIDHSAAVGDPAVRERVLDQWDRLIARIRAIPGMAGFLLPPSIQDLRRAAADGPLVYVIVHEHSCHAVVLRDDPQQPVDVVALPGLTKAAVHDNADLFRRAVDTETDQRSSADEQDTARRQAQQVLAWTWDAVTGPVLDHLGYDAPPPAGAEWPRIWWCPVGAATFLPLHAAGHHPETRDGVAQSVNTVIDRVIFSYTPTARALLHTAGTTGSPAPHVLVVAAPGSAALPSATREVELLRDLVPSATVLPQPGHVTTRDAVLNALPAHAIAHFACHGVSDWQDPATSHLALDGHSHPLTVSEISALHLADARMAYLSACSTADTNPRHADEATHLTAAFYLAGYRTVIGALWPVGDLTARLVARDTYRYLTQDGTVPPDPARAVHALHHAVRGIRKSRPTHVIRWAAHIHVGR